MKLKKDGTIDKRFNPNKKVVDEKTKQTIKMYWILRKAGSLDWMNKGIYMTEGIYITKDGQTIHTRND
jgi:hypothetical protein